MLEKSNLEQIDFTIVEKNGGGGEKQVDTYSFLAHEESNERHTLNILPVIDMNIKNCNSSEFIQKKLKSKIGKTMEFFLVKFF